MRVPSDVIPYPLFAYAGLLPWMFFSNVVSTSSYSLVVNSYIVTKVYFPRLIIPAAIVGVRLVDFLVASVVLIGLMLGYGISVRSSILLLPVLIVQVTVFTFGIGLWFQRSRLQLQLIATRLRALGAGWFAPLPVCGRLATFAPLAQSKQENQQCVDKSGTPQSPFVCCSPWCWPAAPPPPTSAV